MPIYFIVIAMRFVGLSCYRYRKRGGLSPSFSLFRFIHVVLKF
nr:MAG TPA_asm: hypothetical protein [Caudoviricetes sp.]